MCRKATIRLCLVFWAAATAGLTQTGPPRVPALEWRRIGNTVLELGLPSPAGGPVSRVWYSPDGRTLYTRTAAGRNFASTDLAPWVPAPGVAVPARIASATNASDFVHLPSEIVVRDTAVHPRDAEQIVVASDQGVWRSTDRGLSWFGLNAELPNLPVRRILAGPEGGLTRIALQDNSEVVWRAGERSGWRTASESSIAAEAELRRTLSRVVGAEVSAVSAKGETWHAGVVDGRLFSSTDHGQTWRAYPVTGAGPITRIFADRNDEAFALAIVANADRQRVLRTRNSGGFWEDITNNLPQAVFHGVTADRTTGAVYVGTSSGLFISYPDSSGWLSVNNNATSDVFLDDTGNQIYVALDGAGVYGALAPHRMRDPRVVSAADRLSRAVAPGSLVSVLGSRVTRASVGERTAPILATADSETQIQVPFEVTGSVAVGLTMDSSAGPLRVGLPIRPAAPSIFIDRDGNPLVMNADTGLMLDAAAPARSGSRVQIMATGLGQVTPVWPSGLQAPLENPPRVVAPVAVYLDREALPVLRSILAPGYVGMYLVEVQLPKVVNTGSAELYLSMESEQSNRVRIWLEP